MKTIIIAIFIFLQTIPVYANIENIFDPIINDISIEDREFFESILDQLDNIEGSIDPSNLYVPIKDTEFDDMDLSEILGIDLDSIINE